MTVTNRDLALLEGLGTFRVLTLEQIQKHYFGGLRRCLVQRRLGKLRAKNLLRSFPFGDRGLLAWTLTAEAARRIGRPTQIFRRPPNRNTLVHDLEVADLGLEFKRLGILHEWLSTYEIERELYSSGRHVPDALFRLQVGGRLLGPIALEVENTLKSQERIRTMLSEYYHYFKVTDLWLFWKKDWMRRNFKRHASKGGQPRVWVAKNSLHGPNKFLVEDLRGATLDVYALGKSAEDVNEARAQSSVLSDTPSDTSAISTIDPQDLLREHKKHCDSGDFGSSDTPASAFTDVTDPSLSTSTIRDKGVSNRIRTTECLEVGKKEKNKLDGVKSYE